MKSEKFNAGKRNLKRNSASGPQTSQNPVPFADQSRFKKQQTFSN
jgi:hypothetical protein